MSGFSSWSRRQRQAIVGAGVVLAALAGIMVHYATSDDKTPLNVDFVLGGGTDVTGKGDQLAIQGNFRGLAAAPDGTIYLFTQEDDKSDNGMVMWRKKSSGAAERINISGMNEVTANQAAVAPDGSAYLATAKGLWKVSPDGKATIAVKGDCKTPDPLVTAVKKFCAQQITGVALDEDGSIYIGDQVVWGDVASYVHRIDGDSIELVAGRAPKRGESYKRSNQAVKNGTNPATGTKAKDVLVPETINSGWLASGKDGIYWRTGPGIVRINDDRTLSPFVASKAPDKIGEVQSPFTSVGRALDAKIPRSVQDHAGGLAAIPGRGEVYYADPSETGVTPTFEGDFSWHGVTSGSQKKLLESSASGSVVYRVADGELAPVIAGVQALATSDNSLYVAVESDGGERSGPEDWETAVLRVRLPK